MYSNIRIRGFTLTPLFLMVIFLNSRAVFLPSYVAYLFPSEPILQIHRPHKPTNVMEQDAYMLASYIEKTYLYQIMNKI